MDSMIKHYPYQVSYIKPNGSPMKMEFMSEGKAKDFAAKKVQRSCTTVTIEQGDFEIEEYVC